MGGVRCVWIAETGGACFLRVAAGIQGIVVVKPETRAVKLVRATARDGIENGARVATVFSAELVRDQPHFLNRIRIVQRDCRTRDAEVVVVLTIDHEVVGANSSAVYREVRSTRESALS